jgi:hypothetical protein
MLAYLDKNTHRTTPMAERVTPPTTAPTMNVVWDFYATAWQASKGVPHSPGLFE